MGMTGKQIFHVGDRAMYPLVGSEIEVEVIEERGPIGIDGMHLVRIRVCKAFTEPYEIEVAEDWLRPITDVGLTRAGPAQ